MKIAAIAGLSGAFLVLGALTACGDDDDDGSNGGTGGGDASAGMGGDGGNGGGTAGSGGTAGGGSGGTAGSGGTSGTGGTTDGGPADAGTLSFSGGVVEGTAGMLFENEPPLEGVEVCIVNASGMTDTAYECSTTDATGAFSISGLPPNTELIASFIKDGYVSQVKPLDLGTASIMLPTDFRMGSLLADGGAPRSFGMDPSVALEAGMGTVNFFGIQPHVGDASPPDVPTGVDWVDGLSVTISPAGGDGPFYLDANEVYRPGATSTGEGGYGGWFINLAPGEYVLSFSHPTMSCAPLPGAAFGWPEGANSVRTPILADMNTQAVGVLCTQPTDSGAP